MLSSAIYSDQQTGSRLIVYLHATNNNLVPFMKNTIHQDNIYSCSMTLNNLDLQHCTLNKSKLKD